MTMTSCEATAQIYSPYSETDYTFVITHGTPHYDVDGYIMYYMYDGMYYYPYYRHNRYIFYRYYRPLPPNVYRRSFRPVPRDWHHKPQPRHMPPTRNYNGTVRPHGNFNHQDRSRSFGRPNTTNRPHYGGNRGRR